MFLQKKIRRNSLLIAQFSYTNTIFKITSSLKAEEDAQTTINKTLSLLDVDSDSSLEREEENNNSILFVPHVLKLKHIRRCGLICNFFSYALHDGRCLIGRRTNSKFDKTGEMACKTLPTIGYGNCSIVESI